MSDTLNIYGHEYPNTTGFKAKDASGNTLTFTRGGASFTGTVYQDENGYVVLDDDPGANTSLTWLNVKKNGTYNAPTGVAYNKVNVDVAPENDVMFYDYDGTVLYSYTAQQFAALTEMPANPSHTGLTAQGWNWTLETAKQYVATYGMLDIGQMYVTDDLKSRFYITIANDENTSERDIPFSIRFRTSVLGGVTIDWGDGSTEVTTGAANTKTTYTHTYSQNGDYVVTLQITSGNLDISGTAMFFLDSSYYNASRVKKIELGQVTLSDTNTDSFNSMYNLETIILPNVYVANIGRGAFQNCYKLKHITFPISCTDIGDGSGGGSGSFKDNYSLKSVSMPNTVANLRGRTFENDSQLKRLTIPPQVAIITGYICSCCYDLEAVVIPNTVNSFSGDYQFQNCYSLRSVTIPPHVASLPLSAFIGCKSLKSVTMSGNFLTTIGNTVFKDCRSLESLSFPTSLETLGNNVFGNCHNLKTVTGLDNVTSWGSDTFHYCMSLEAITIPGNIAAFSSSQYQAGEFSYCQTLRKLTIPSSVATIPANTFFNDTNMEEYHFLATTPPTLSNTNAFSGIPADCKIYVPYSADHSVLNAYQTATNWSTYASYMVEEAAS